LTQAQLNFEIHLLDKRFARDDFDCGHDALNKFLKSSARQNQSAGANRTFVAIVAGEKKKRVVGFYSQSMGQIDLSTLPVESQRKLPRHPVPVARMGRLAVDRKMKGHGLGGLLLADALKRIKLVSVEIGVFAAVVDAKDQVAKSFYEKYGFVELTSDPMTLFLPIATIPGFD
jgi:ribosomal protein S18 acetylase RimI-like enzyme